MQAESQRGMRPTSSAFSRLSTFCPQTPEVRDHELLCLIGRGAYGEVWMARNAIGTLRAVKIVHRQSFLKSEHFEREFKGLLKFEPISRSHDGLVDILQIGRRDDAGYFYYVMELADGAMADAGCRMLDAGPPSSANQRKPVSSIRYPESYSPRTLRSELQARGSLPPTDCLTLGLKLASALEHLHTNGLVHRDIKPANIIFAKGEPKLADIGLVTAIDEAQSLVGTAGYIPPEGPGTPQADLYSLGKVLYEIAFGKDRQEFPQLPVDLSSSPDYAALLELNEVILKVCETDPRRRYTDANSLAHDLVALRRGRSVKRRRLWQRRLGFAKILGAAAVVILAVVFTVSVLERVGRGHIPKPEALDLYKDGQWQYSQLTPDAHVKAYNYLTQAVQVDPEFVQPYGELTALYTWLMIPGITNEQVRLQKVREIADKAMAINPNSAEAHTALSWCRFLERDWRGAEDEIRRAIELNSRFALAHGIYCFYLSMQGRIDEAHQVGQRAVELEPRNSRRVTAIIASWPFMAERRFDLAITQLHQVLELDRNFAGGHGYLGDCYQAQSNYPAAIEQYKASDLYSGLDAAKVEATYASLRKAFDTRGPEGYWRKRIALIEADQALPEEERLQSDNLSPMFLAGCYAKLGEKEKALEELKRHFGEPQVWHQIKFEPLYDSLHDEPQFIALVKQAGLEP